MYEEERLRASRARSERVRACRARCDKGTRISRRRAAPPEPASAHGREGEEAHLGPHGGRLSMRAHARATPTRRRRHGPLTPSEKTDPDALGPIFVARAWSQDQRRSSGRRWSPGRRCQREGGSTQPSPPRLVSPSRGDRQAGDGERPLRTRAGQSDRATAAGMEGDAGVLDDRHHRLVDKLVETFKLQDRALAENFVKYARAPPAPARAPPSPRPHPRRLTVRAAAGRAGPSRRTRRSMTSSSPTGSRSSSSCTRCPTPSRTTASSRPRAPRRS